MVTSGYNITHVDDVPLTQMAEIEAVDEKFNRLGVQNLDEEKLGTEEMKVKIWIIPPGERMGVHGHPTQEEFYYILEGYFRISLGPPGKTDTLEAGPGMVFAASANVARRYENIGEENGRVLTVAAPNVSEGGIPEQEMIE